MSEKTLNNNSEILFLYDAKMCNPNGDMDDENKPRMDYDTSTNLVSDVRLKRYIRDYFENVLNKEIFVTEKAEKAEKRVEQILKRKPDKNKPITEDDIKKISSICYDIKFFGAVFGTSGGNDHVTGPVQFNWGYSLNPVELVESSTITSSFSSGEGIGKDFRVKYSFIAFDGTVNALLSESTELTDDDLNTFDKSVIKSIPFNKTRSKTGQTPRLYMRVETAKDLILKDLRDYICLSYKTEDYKIRGINDISLDLNELKEYLLKNKESIQKIYYWADDALTFKDNKSFEEIFNEFNLAKIL